jgi:4-hydroxy-tetrahydrodipicolinate synthase
LSEEDKIRVLQTIIDENAGRLPVYAGVGCITTRDTVRLAQKAQECGADAVSVITPFFGQVSQNELINHYRSVAESIDIPVILYNIPGRTGNNIDYTTLEKLSRIDNIVAIKDSSGNFDNILKYLEVTGRRFAVLSGNDSLILYNLIAGGTGAVAGCANIFPNKMVQIYNLFKQGKIEEAMKIQDGIRPVRNCLSMGNPNSVVKRIVNLLGYNVGPARAPFDISYSDCDNRILEVLETYYKYWD